MSQWTQRQQRYLTGLGMVHAAHPHRPPIWCSRPQPFPFSPGYQEIDLWVVVTSVAPVTAGKGKATADRSCYDSPWWRIGEHQMLAPSGIFSHFSNFPSLTYGCIFTEYENIETVLLPTVFSICAVSRILIGDLNTVNRTHHKALTSHKILCTL